MDGRPALAAALSCSLLCACAPERADSTNASAPVTASAVANGKAIFQTGKDIDGVAIRAQKPPLYPACAACHHADGSGGRRLPGSVTSADLRHAALVTHQKIPYTQALLERAISTGIDNMGQPLNPVMPHWTLSKRDLHDVANYVLMRLK